MSYFVSLGDFLQTQCEQILTLKHSYVSSVDRVSPVGGQSHFQELETTHLYHESGVVLMRPFSAVKSSRFYSILQWIFYLLACAKT